MLLNQVEPVELDFGLREKALIGLFIVSPSLLYVADQVNSLAAGAIRGFTICMFIPIASEIINSRSWRQSLLRIGMWGASNAALGMVEAIFNPGSKGEVMVPFALWNAFRYPGP